MRIRVIGETVDIQRQGRGGIANPGQETSDRVTVGFDRPTAARTPGFLNQEPDRDRVPRVVHRLDPCPGLGEGEGCAHEYILAFHCWYVA